MRGALLLSLLSAVACGRYGFVGTDDASGTATGDASDAVDALSIPLRGSLAAGRKHTCAILTGGRVRCWGLGQFGQLGYASMQNIGDDELPASAGDVDLGGVAVEITAGVSMTCARLDTGSVRCWGAGVNGQLGYGNELSIGDDETPASIGDIQLGGTAIAIDAGGNHACALLSTGAIRCWGYGAEGSLGHAAAAHIGDDEPVSAAGDAELGEPVIDVAAGAVHTCVRTSRGPIRCFGRGTRGQLGYASVSSLAAPSAGDVMVGAVVVEIAAGIQHTCARLDTGNVRCWGDGIFLGRGVGDDIGDDEVPAAGSDVTLGGLAVEITANLNHTCARLDSGAVRCWGAGEDGKLGYGNTMYLGSAQTVSSAGDIDLGGRAVEIVAGETHTCARLDSGAIRCWGAADAGQLGYGNTTPIGDNEPASAGGDVRVE